MPGLRSDMTPNVVEHYPAGKRREGPAWRYRCACGWTVLVPAGIPSGKAAIRAHIDEELARFVQPNLGEPWP